MCGEDCGRRPQWSLAVVAAVVVVADPITVTLLTRHSTSFLFSRPRVTRSRPVRAHIFWSVDITLLGKMNGLSRALHLDHLSLFPFFAYLGGGGGGDARKSVTLAVDLL